jgi:hypothetical protein
MNEFNVLAIQKVDDGFVQTNREGCEFRRLRNHNGERTGIVVQLVMEGRQDAVGTTTHSAKGKPQIGKAYFELSVTGHPFPFGLVVGQRCGIAIPRHMRDAGIALLFLPRGRTEPHVDAVR